MQAGVGMALALDPAGRHIPLVTALVQDMPAATCGRIAVGDRLIAVDKEPTQGHSLTCVHDLILGAVGTTVRLRLRRPAREYEVELVRSATGGHEHVQTGPEAPKEDLGTSKGIHFENAAIAKLGAAAADHCTADAAQAPLAIPHDFGLENILDADARIVGFVENTKLD